jgi:hypothetical protein
LGKILHLYGLADDSCAHDAGLDAPRMSQAHESERVDGAFEKPPQALDMFLEILDSNQQ